MKTKRKLFTLPRLIILALFCLVSVFCIWLFMRSVLVKGLMTGIQDMETQGYQIGHGGIAITGFPFSIRTRSDGVSIQAPSGNKTDISKNWSVKLDQVSAKGATLWPLSWELTHDGTARVDIHGITGARYMFDVAPANLNTKASISITGALKDAHFDFGPTKLRPLVGTPPILSAVENMQGDFTTSGTQGHLVLSGKNLTLNDNALGALKNLLGRELSYVNLDIDIDNWPALEKQGVPIWQDNMGRIRSNEVSLKWGKVDLTADFDVRFIENSPDGIVHIYVKDTKTLFDTLAKSGLINPSIASQANLFLSTLKIDENGYQKIDLILRDHKLKYGFITLYKF